MALSNPVFINEFQKGSSENANIGFGSFVGIETYSKKGIAQLTKDTSAASGTILGLVKYIVNDNTGTNLYAMGIATTATQFYESITLGQSWTQTGSISSSVPYGMIWFQGYLLAFIHNSSSGAANIAYSSDGGNTWTSWITTGLNFGMSAYPSEAAPFIFPNDSFIYFGNGNQVGKIGLGTSATLATLREVRPEPDYFFNAAQLTLPSFYQVNCFSFLPSNYLALGTSAVNNSQVADVILWNPTLSTYGNSSSSLFSRTIYKLNE